MSTENQTVSCDAAIIIPAITNNPLVELCVRECNRLFPSAEIIVLLDSRKGSEPLEPFAKIIETGSINMSVKRNIGARETSRRYIAFIDSDAFPCETWLTKGIEILESDPSIWISGGPNVAPPNEPFSERLVGLVQKSVLITGHYNFRKRRAPARFCLDLASCNMVLRREDYLSIGGMAEHLYVCEDRDLCSRIVEKGKKIHYDPDVLVYHKNRTLTMFALQRLAWGGGVWKLFKDKLDIKNFYLPMPMFMVLFLMTGFFLSKLPAWYGYGYCLVNSLYVLLLVAEAVRISERATDLPGVTVALMIGNLSPGVGSILQLFGLLPDLRKFYRNHKEEQEA